MDLLADMRLFARIVATGSLSAAGRELGLSPGAVSQRLKAREARYATTLLNRSSRALSLTEEGLVFLDSARRLVAEVEALEAKLSDQHDQLSGRLRIAAPSDLGRSVVEPLVLDFADAHPALHIEFHVGDALDDLVADDFDVLFRYGNLQDSALVARPLAGNRRLVVASPSYLADRRTPQHPGDLEDHKCLVLIRGMQSLTAWRFVIDGEEVVQQISPALAVNDGEILRRWALQGRGIAIKSLLDVHEDIEAGRLVELLSEFSPSHVGAQIVISASRRNTARIRAFVDYALRRFEQLFGARQRVSASP